MVYGRFDKRKFGELAVSSKQQERETKVTGLSSLTGLSWAFLIISPLFPQSRNPPLFPQPATLCCSEHITHHHTHTPAQALRTLPRLLHHLAESQGRERMDPLLVRINRCIVAGVARLCLNPNCRVTTVQTETFRSEASGIGKV